MFRKEKDPARIGLTAHTAILHKLVSLGFEVLQPLNDDLRYDLAYYWAETAELVRIQCKAGRYVPEIGCILFKNYNSTGGRTKKKGIHWGRRIFRRILPGTEQNIPHSRRSLPTRSRSASSSNAVEK